VKLATAMFIKEQFIKEQVQPCNPRSANRQRDSSRDPGWQGLTNKDIARVLLTSEQVVKNYLRTAFDKLGVWTRLELALYVAATAASTGMCNWATAWPIAAWDSAVGDAPPLSGATPRTTISAPQAQLCREFMRCASESAQAQRIAQRPTSTSIRGWRGKFAKETDFTWLPGRGASRRRSPVPARLI